MPKCMNIPKCSERHSSSAFCVTSSTSGFEAVSFFVSDVEDVQDDIKIIATSNKLIMCFIIIDFVDFNFCKDKKRLKTKG